MQLHELPGEREAEARAFPLFTIHTGHLLELLEDPSSILWGDANPGVPDGDLHLSTMKPCRDADPASIGSGLHSIGEEIEDHWLDLAFVGLDDVQS